MKLKEAIQMLRSYVGMTYKMTDNQGRPKLDQAIEIVLSHLTKQEKMIELMAEKVSHMVFIDDNHKVCMFANKEEAKQYFEKKAEESE